MSSNFLIIVNERLSSFNLENYLQKLGYNIVAICTSVREAYEKAITCKVDLIIMDDKLFDGDAIDLAKQIKMKCNLPIIFLSTDMNKAIIKKAIEIDPVAYLLKPFNHLELCAAIKIGLSHVPNEVYTRVGDIPLDKEFSFDTKSLQLICCGEEVHLSKKERQLLELFLDNQNRLISFMTMEYELWEDKPSNDSRRRTLISRLRVKLKHQFIKTYASEGYIFKV